MEATIYNVQGKKAGTIALPEKVFGEKWNDSLIHQVVTSMKSGLCIAKRPSYKCSRGSHTSGRGYYAYNIKY
jgi:ribosomal protein L4